MTKAKQYLKMFLGLFPSRLPVGMTEFDAWVQDIIDTYSLSGIADIDSLKWAIAGSVMALGPTKAFKPKVYFALVVSKSAANQIAGGFMYNLKEKQKADIAAKQAAEASDQEKTKPA